MYCTVPVLKGTLLWTRCSGTALCRNSEEGKINWTERRQSFVRNCSFDVQSVLLVKLLSLMRCLEIEYFVLRSFKFPKEDHRCCKGSRKKTREG